MSVETLIRRALDAGVELRFEGGKLTAKGRSDVLRQWAPILREKKPAIAEVLSRPEMAELDRAYQRHHWKCPTCIAAGKGYGLRCGAGTALWAAYQERDLGTSGTRAEEAQP